MHTRRVLVARSEHSGWPGILSALESMADIRVIGTPTSLADAAALVRQHQPGLLVSADEVRGERTIPVMHALRKHAPATRFLVVGDDYQHDELLLISEAGIPCYLYWDDLLVDLVENLRVAIAGNTVLLSDAIAAAHLATERYRQQDDGSRFDMTDREIQVLRGLVEGLSHREIANVSEISTRTVERILEHLQEKLDAPNAYALIMKAAQHGAIP